MGYVVVSGLKELQARLAEIGPTMPRRLATVNKQAGDIAVAEIRRRAPRGKHEGGGRIVPIADSVKATRSENYVAVKAGGPQTPHAKPTEFGGTIARRGSKGVTGRQWARRGHHGGRTRIKRRPFFYSGVAAKAAEIVKKYEGMLEQMMSELAD